MNPILQLANLPALMVDWKVNAPSGYRLVESIVASANDYANVGGGYVVVGGREKWNEQGYKDIEILGIANDDCIHLCQYVASGIINMVSPHLEIEVEQFRLETRRDHRVLLFKTRANKELYKLLNKEGEKAQIPIRIGKSLGKALELEEKGLRYARSQSANWDKLPNQKALLPDLDGLVLRLLLTRMDLWLPNRPYNDYLSETDCLDEFLPPILARSSANTPLHPLNFALLIFGRHPSDFIDGAFIHFRLFNGIKGVYYLTKELKIGGNLCEQAHTAINLLNIESVLDSLSTQPEKAVGNPKPFPELAIREVVFNALLHRNYQLNRPVNISVYPDRLEIASPGEFYSQPPNGWNFGPVLPAKQRNQALCRMFHKLKFTAMDGMGLQKIKWAMHESGFPEPEMECGPDWVKVVLRREVF